MSPRDIIPKPDEPRLASHTTGSAPAPHDGARQRRILLVDDNQDAALLLGELLQALGNEVEIAHDGEQALERIRTFRPDVAILDIGLPNVDGYELATQLGSRIAGLRMMAISGYGEAGDERSARAGFETHFVKPVTLAKLVAALDSAVSSP